MNSTPDDLACACGRHFAQPNALTNHRNACTKSKKRISDVLTRAKEVWNAKRRKLDTANPSNSLPTETAEAVVPHASAHDDRNIEQPSSSIPVAQSVGPDHGASSTNDQDNDRTLPGATASNARPRRENAGTLPGRYEDMVPHSLASLVPETIQETAGQAEPAKDHHDSPAEPAKDHRDSPADEAPSVIRSRPNKFGLFREYQSSSFPLHDPEDEQTLEDFVDIESLRKICMAPDITAANRGSTDHTESSEESSPSNDYWPYPNQSSFLLGDWYWNASSQKSKREFQKLVDIISRQDFQIGDIQDTPWREIDAVLGNGTVPKADATSGKEHGFDDAGWTREPITIQVPFHRSTGVQGAKQYKAGHFFRRSVVDILKEKVSGPDFKHFHLQPYRLLWEAPMPSSDNTSSLPPQPQQVYGEAYYSQEFLRLHNEIQKAPSQPADCALPRVVVALMFASDETHLTQFGETKLWPLYLFFGNESKYRRCQPNLHLCHHVAYLAKLSDDFKDFYHEQTEGKRPSVPLMAHCSREIFHAQWKIILDEDFVVAYVYGVVIKCFDGILRRFYLRIFTYSADYREKTIITTIRNLGGCPCPRCLTPLDIVQNMGLPLDRWWRTYRRRDDDEEYRKKINQARTIIYKQNLTVDSKKVEAILKPESLVATQNAFSARLAQHGFNIFRSVTNDLMHEVESGTWRSFFIHLLRILDCIGDGSTQEMDWRYRQVPTFGRDTIRRFRRNCSDMKNLAARDWEDMLQCSIPVFEDLLPGDDNKHLLDALFLFATWHGLAKLRIHTDATLRLLDQTTTSLGDQLRVFQGQVCSHYATRELAKELLARTRRQAKSSTKKTQPTPSNASIPGVSSAATNADPPPVVIQAEGIMDQALPSSSEMGPIPDTERTNMLIPADEPQDVSKAHSSSSQAVSGRQMKSLNLQTYKFHAMGDYVETIKAYGTTDSYSTEPGELEHRTPKNRYSRTSKKNYVLQITQIERRQARIRRIRQRMLSRGDIPPPSSSGKSSGKKSKSIPTTDRYVIGQNQNRPVDIIAFCYQNVVDPAIKHFYRNLREHLLIQARQIAADSTITSILLHKERLYQHRILRLNYTTYNIRRAQDVINPNTSHCNIMIPSRSTIPEEANNPEDTHTGPYRYARVLGIFHANVIYVRNGVTDPDTKRMHFLWVRWYQLHPSKNSLRLDQLTFPLLSGDNATGFVDPQNVIRACHIIPALAEEKRYTDANDHGTSKLGKDRNDWNCYYVNHFADRDLLMRYYWGYGIGHTKSLAIPPRCLTASTTGPNPSNDKPTEQVVKGPLATVTRPVQNKKAIPDDNTDQVDAEHGLDERENEILDLPEGNGEVSEEDENEDDDLEYLELHAMYHDD